jgi:pyruvate/2-oxoacid:ferredoxin oxidoreductase beta subunit
VWRITFRPKHPVPVGDFLRTQGRFTHLSPEQIEAIQAHVDERWNLLGGLASSNSTSNH